MKKIKTSLRIFFKSFIYCLVAPVVVLAEDGTCPPLSEYISEGTGNNFLLNSAFESVIKACNTVAELSWNSFAEPLQLVVALGAAIYIATYTLKNIGSFSQQDFASYFSNDKTGIIPLMVKVAVVTILLSAEGKTFMYRDFIGPIVSASMEVGARFGDFSAGSGFSDVGNISSLFNNVLNKIRELNGSTYKIVAMGRELLCLTFMPDGFLDKFWILLPFGVMLFILGWFICIGIAFYMLDILFRLAVGCMLLPMAIACGVSKFTVLYTQQTWNLFVNVCFNFMALGMVASFSVKILEKAIAGNSKIMGELTSNAILTEAQVEQLCDHMAEQGVAVGLVLTFICSLIIFKLFTEIEGIAEKVSGTSAVGSKGGAQATTAPFMSGAVRGSKKLAWGATKSALRKSASDVANSGTGVAVRTFGRNMKNGLKTRVKRVFRLK